MTLEDFKVLEKYYDKLYVIVANQSVYKFDLQMKSEIWAILLKYHETVGLCSKCSSNLISIAQRAIKLYNLNIEEYAKRSEQGEAGSGNKKAGRRSNKRKDTDNAS